MPFYSEFSKNYDKIFPLNSKKLSLLDNMFKDLATTRNSIHLLDIGCGTGNYALALAKLGYQLEAVDLDSEMIALAKAKAATEDSKDLKLKFHNLNMLALAKEFKPGSFQGAYIIGNVLVHLTESEIKQFLKITAGLLVKDAKLFIQIVNYDRILDLNLAGLPTIYSNDNSLYFTRNYEYQKEENTIFFETKLIDNLTDNLLFQNKVALYPLRQQELMANLKEAGFKVLASYGSSKGTSYKKLSSVPLIISAQKNT